MGMIDAMDDNIEISVNKKFLEERTSIEKLVKEIQERESTLRMVLNLEDEVEKLWA